MEPTQRIALIAHNFSKDDLLDCVDYDKDRLMNHQLYGSGTTVGLIEKKLNLDVHCFMSGPLGGNLQVGADHS